MSSEKGRSSCKNKNKTKEKNENERVEPCKGVGTRLGRVRGKGDAVTESDDDHWQSKESPREAGEGTGMNSEQQVDRRGQECPVQEQNPRPCLQ